MMVKPPVRLSAVLLLLLFVVAVPVSVAQRQQSAAAPLSPICTKESEWEDHPALCRILERLHHSDEASGVVQELHQFAAAAGWLVGLRPPQHRLPRDRDPNDNNNNNSDMRDAVAPLRSQSRHHRRRNRVASSSLSDTTSYHNRHDGSSSSSSSSNNSNNSTANSSITPDISKLPVVLAHGMGDSCFNSGMQRVTAAVAAWHGAFAVCIPTGPSQQEDTKNGYFLNMDASVDVFRDAVAQIPELQHGFHALGFSQGNNVIRGYIAKYNAPATVHTFLSVNGVNAGIGAVPYCRPESIAALMLSAATTSSTSSSTIDAAKRIAVAATSMCDLLMEQASHAAYTEFAQQHSFQANYWRDPRPVAADLYQTYSQLAVWNNEVPSSSDSLNETLRDNWAKTSRFVWVLARDDKMVWPAAGEQWGAPDPANPFEHILPMKETEWYKQDLFGLKTADDAGKNYFESFDGDHLQFTEDDLKRWVTTYFSA